MPEKQLQPLVIGGVNCCRRRHTPVQGRETFCRTKKPRCRQAFHREREKEKIIEAAAFDIEAAFDTGHAVNRGVELTKA